jgi:hypothetical protein
MQPEGWGAGARALMETRQTDAMLVRREKKSAGLGLTRIAGWTEANRSR